jgi:hypothetical protein
VALGEDALKVVRFRQGNNGSGYPDGISAHKDAAELP